MKVHIDMDEWYPVYSIAGSGDMVEIPKDKLEWIQKTTKEFTEVQEYLNKKHLRQERGKS